METKVLSKGHLAKTTTNPQPPLEARASGHGKGVASVKPTKPLVDDSRRVLESQASAKGRDSSSSTFKAPRGGESHNPAECGYTKP